jgi:hypothetical protein
MMMTESEPRHCVFASNKNGWGNAILFFMYAVLSQTYHNVDDTSSVVFPCVVDYKYGGVFSKLFQNIQPCPQKKRIYNERTCIRFPTDARFPTDIIAGVNGKTALYIARDMIDSKRDQFPTLFQLNKTFVDEIFRESGASFNVDELRNQSCAFHIRFGDYYFRDHNKLSKKKEEDRRSCKSEDVHSCFQEMAEQIQASYCPNPNVPMYLATDLPEFVRYFCSVDQQHNRSFLSSCAAQEDTTSHGKHIRDVAINRFGKTMSAEGLQVLHGLLMDWLALTFAKEKVQRKPFRHVRKYGSTFVETADLGFYV